MRRCFYLLLTFALTNSLLGQINKTREDYENFLKNHPLLNRDRYLRKGHKVLPKPDRPDYAREMEIIKTMDPATGQVPWEKKIAALQQTRVLQQKISRGMIPYTGISGVNWVERGPNNVGGRTRALMFDPNDASKKKVWAAGVTGGLWYNSDITNANSSWVKISDLWESISITCIAYDPNNTQIFYVGTGEGFGAGAGRGAGIWKTTDGGSSWAQLASTTSYFYINDIVVRNESGISVVYAAVASEYYEGVWHGTGEGLQRSANGGTTWSQVMPNISSNPYQPSDIEIGADNRIYIGTRDNSYGNGGGTILYSTTGLSASWTIVNKYSGVTNVGRVELACAPSDVNVVYALIEAGNKVYTCAVSKDKGVNWNNHTQPDDADTGIAPTDFSRDQAWYDLILAVDPNNALRVVAGAIDLFLSSDSMNTWTQISKWSNNPNLNTLNCSIVHSDQHALVFQPGSSNTMIFGNDGGVFYTSQLNSAGTSDVIASRNKGYNVTQFYSAALHPTAGSNTMLAGAQDNGTQRFDNPGMNSTTEVNGGDGAFCFIDQDQPQYMIASYVYNDYSRSSDGGVSFPTQLSSNTNGSFINPADYDDRENILYSGRTATTIQRILSVTGSFSVSSVTIASLGSQASAFACSPYSTPGTSTVFVGTSAGKLFKLTNAHATPTTVNITGASFPTGYISCIEIGASENELLVTFSNYNVKSVWYSSNGGSSWVSKDESGYGLPDMPIRWAIFRPSDRKQVLLATETGVWSTTDITAANPDWQPTNTGLGNIRSDMLQIRSSDYAVMLSTHGRGTFTTTAFSPPNADFYSDKRVSYLSTNVVFTDNSVQASSYSWNFGSGATPATATGPGPHTVQYTTAGLKTVSLVINGGVDTETKADYIHVLPSYSGAYTLAMGGDFETNVNDFAAHNVAGTPFQRGNSAISGKNGVVSGSNAWVTGLAAANYASNTVAYLYAPNFDFSAAGTYTIAFKSKYDFSADLGYDGFRIEYSTDKGSTWNQLAPTVAANWYDRNTAADNSVFPPSTPFFSALISSYSNRTRDISSLAGNANVAFRFVFKSDFTITDVGLAIDDFTLTVPADVTPPSVTNLSPPDDATGVSISSNLVMTFSENVQKGTGNITIKENGSTTQTINVTSGSVTVSGNTVTIDPSNFTQGVVVNVEMPAGIIKDMSNNNYAGILSSTAWNFCTTPNAPTAGNNGPVCEGSNLNLTASTVTGASYYWTGPGGFTSTTQNPVRTNATVLMSGAYDVVAIVGGCTSGVASTNVVVNAKSGIVSTLVTNILQKEATVNWTLTQSADSVKVFFKLLSSINWWKIVTVVGQDSLRQNMLTPGQTIAYQVKTFLGNCVDSTGILTFNTRPPCGNVTAFNVTNIQTNQARLSWVKNEDPDSFVIWYRKIGTSPWTKINVGIDTARVVTGLTPETDYEWRVVSYCGANYYPYNPLLNFTTLASCNAPTNLNVTDITTNLVKLWWDTIPGASYYHVSWRVLGAPTWLNRLNVYASPVLHSNTLVPSTSYEWRIRASCGGQYSSWSALDTFTTANPKESNFTENEDFRIYPNPTQGLFTVQISAKPGTLYHYKVVSMLGQVITEKEGTIESKPADLLVDISNQAKGVYVLYLNISGQSYYERIMLE